MYNINKKHKHHLHIISYRIISYINYHIALYHLQNKCQLFLFSKKYILCWHNIIQQFNIQCDNLQELQKKLNMALRKYLQAQPLTV
jgi:hypothetical protein